jgi:hypothetical protein
MSFTHGEMALELQKLIYSKRTWIRTFAGKRPAHEVNIRKRELAVLEQAHADYERAARKRAA